MSFIDERPEFEREFGEFYATYPIDVSHIVREMDEVSATHPEWLPYRRKALIYETAAKRCDVNVFRHYPFYFEAKTGRVRSWWGFDGIGSWLIRQPFGRELAAECEAWWKPCGDSGLSLGNAVIDLDHHCIGYDNVLALGLKGLIAKAEARLARTTDERARSFLESTTIANRSLIAIAGKFAARAEAMLVNEPDPAVRARLERIVDTARRVPAEPPSTFYEALNTLLFMRESSASLEGLGVSVLGHPDRMLGPYYRRDLAAGRITRDEAKDLLSAYLAMTDAKFEVDKRHETSTTVVIGGCDAEGAIVFNEVTRMIVEAYGELRLLNPKLNARISPRHPDEYFERLGDLAAQGTNVLAVFNDDVLIEANVKRGKAREDARLYVAGGCQENLLQNTEINSRASIYLNLPQVFHMGLCPEGSTPFTDRAGISLETYEGCRSFGELYDAFLHNLEAVLVAHIAQRNRSEDQGWRYNPCPLHSATIDDCIENAQDMMEGGARYSVGSVSLIGIGTLIDSLFAVRTMVFEHDRIPLDQLRVIIESNFEGEETLRQFIVNRVPKFGQADEAMEAFSSKVFSDLAAVSTGHANGRGGTYEASVFVYRLFVEMGKKTGATPDGRKAGEYLSQGMSPSPLALGRRSDVGQILGALAPLDMTEYPVSAVLDLKLPASRGRCDPGTIVPIVKRFLDAGGSVLQLNVVDPEILREAKAHPERHPDLVVRVSGYSARFAALSEEIQQEVIDRAVVAL